MIRRWTLNKAIIFLVDAIVVFVGLAFFVPTAYQHYLRDIFNSLAFGGALWIALTWRRETVEAIKDEAGGGVWQLMLGITCGWTVVAVQRLYSMAFNWLGRPESWIDSPISMFWPYAYMICAYLFLAAPGISSTKEVLRYKTYKYLIGAALVGAFLSGIVLGASIATD